jgi:2-methylcitrate dehydratase PrpD
MSATATLAEYVAEMRYERLPRAVVDATKVAILDGVANVLAGSTQPPARVVFDYVREMGGTPTSSVFGRGFKTNPPFAAFANGVALHCLDYEIQGQPASHGTSSILPPILALAERQGATGKDIVTAFALGWDVQQRIRTAGAKANLRGFHPPGVFGPPAAAAASSWMLKLNEQQTRVAFGIACSRTGGLFANNGTMVKSTHPGNASRMGVESALLAQAGFTANEDIFAARQGYVEALFSGDLDYGVLTRNLGESFHIVDPGFNIKRYPAEIFMQWVIGAVVDLREQHGVGLDDVDWLEVEVPPMHVELSRPKPQSGLDGKFSFEYCAAVALAEDMVGIDAFSDATRFSAPVEAALDKVRLKQNPDIPRNPQEFWIDARARLTDGREVSARCRHYRGSIANPMTREERLVKFDDCVKRVLSDADATRLREMVESLEELDDANALIALLAQPARD